MIHKPTVAEALPRLAQVAGIPFGKLFPGEVDLTRNKGSVGQLLCKQIGLPLDTARCDFSDGELKTNKANSAGLPKETMWVMQIASIIDTLIGNQPLEFGDSELYKKLRNLVYLPVVKEPSDDHARWYFLPPLHLPAELGSPLYDAYRDDYNSICATMRRQLDAAPGSMLSTASGSYLQIRTKDSKPYHRISSVSLGRVVSEKYRGFYLTKDFLTAAQQNTLPRGTF